MDAVAALRADPFFTEAFGEPFVDYFTRLKEFEIGRFLPARHRLGAPRVLRGLLNLDSHVRI